MNKTNFIFKNIRLNSDLAFSNIPIRQSQYLTHAYHRYPARFIPNLATYLIEKNTKKTDTICDPFGGCGTSLVEAKLIGRKSIGTDINPLANLITKAKLTPIRPKVLENSVCYLFNQISKHNTIDENIYEQRLKYWFDDETLHQLNAIYLEILKIDNKKLQRFYLCAFSHILKNCSRWLMKSLKPQVDRKKIPAEPKTIFINHVRLMQRKNNEFYAKLKYSKNLSTEAKFYVRDARNTKIISSSIDYIITSPPYVTSYEYADLHQLSILWFKYSKDWINFKRRFIGTSHRNEMQKPINSPIGSDIYNDLMYNAPALAKKVKAYFEDMNDFFVESKRILKKGKKISIVIGNTKLANVDILNAEVAYEQIQELGFKSIEVEKRETSSQSITPYRDVNSGQFTSVSNPDKRRAYQYEYILTGTK